MARTVDPLVVGKVIGDVIDMFVPMVELSVHYSSRQVANGCHIKPSASVTRPQVQIHGSASPLSTNDLFSLVMVDPDAPSPSEPTSREWLHWIVVDIPQGMDATKGKELVEYMGPKPPTGIHRYVFVLFRQQGPIGKATPQYQMSGARNNFSTRQFAAHNHLGLPVAAVYFNSQKETAKKSR